MSCCPLHRHPRRQDDQGLQRKIATRGTEGTLVANPEDSMLRAEHGLAELILTQTLRLDNFPSGKQSDGAKVRLELDLQKSLQIPQ